MPTVATLNLQDKNTFADWRTFLTSLDIHNFQENELTTIDLTIGIYDEAGKLVATGSIAGNILKYIGVCNKDSAKGTYFNTIISELMNHLAQQGIFHLFVFTKLKYAQSFQHVGFHQLAHTTEGALLETGDTNVSTYVQSIPRIADQDKKAIASIVMNANPFTLGHRYLVETAAKANDLVYVFVVNNDVSLFPTAARLQLVQEGTSDLKNVQVVNGADYMVSYATFPAYFLPTPDAAIKYQTTLDARIFKHQIAPALNIRKRYLGSEPLSRTTDIYNQTLKKELPPEIQVVVIPRLTGSTNQVITATQVRQAIRTGQLATIEASVPATTFTFIKSNLQKLQQRIQKGMNIDGN
ncbi:citC protein [Agrilactobacillus composti DSM 18527 = JCM 14202]|uniref:[Citrate [pro-3S]-lyase] ligase n=1 Tax=Agrilactobacillus composti DSM 18527 = JCM 14202 TaxID=1423734 RepID=A0A0R1XJZ0_9LACO|nr:[citrate (pro-3S)-lyase] ligase [Agrilactobacillus composti]KRM30478.1 citC protein [Agrilactobacillus composti DSM 18527 = JCM 14202]